MKLKHWVLGFGLGMAIFGAMTLVGCGREPIPGGFPAGYDETQVSALGWTNNGPPMDISENVDDFYGMLNGRNDHGTSVMSYFPGISTTNPVPNGNCSGFNCPNDFFYFLDCNSPPCTRAQGAPWTLLLSSNGSHGFNCNIPVYYYEGFFPTAPPHGGPAGVPGLMSTFAGNQGYWFNAADVQCQSHRSVRVAGNTVWQNITTHFGPYSVYVFEEAKDASFSVPNPVFLVEWNINNSTSASQYINDREQFFP